MTGLDDGGVVEGVADGHVQGGVGEGESAGGDEEIAHVDEIRLVDGHLPLEAQLLVVAREDSVVCENGNHADASSFVFRAIRFHADDTVDYT